MNNQALSSVTSGQAQWASSATPTTGIGQFGIVGSGVVPASGNYVFSFDQAPGNATALTIQPATQSFASYSAFSGSTDNGAVSDQKSVQSAIPASAPSTTQTAESCAPAAIMAQLRNQGTASVGTSCAK
jgi:hypothetical protein